jgi:RNA polymerase sigma-70 factor (ECF subfamily)
LRDEDTLSAEKKNPENAAIRREETERLYAALSKLAEKPRSVIVLHYFSGLSFDRVAEIMGTSSGNVRVIASRARAELKLLLSE